MSWSVLPLPMVMALPVVELVRTRKAPPKVALAADRSKVPRLVPPAADPNVRPPVSEGLVVVMDYKSSSRDLDRVKLDHGLQLQLMVYLAALCGPPDAAELLGYRSLMPAGAFYIGLNPSIPAAASRGEAAIRLCRAAWIE